jgi:hypothetical protein
LARLLIKDAKILSYVPHCTVLIGLEPIIEFELFKFTLNVANETGAVTMDQKVFIAEWRMMRRPWTNRVKTLAHELTHVIESSLSVGRSELTHRWLGEGFAEWVSFKVVDALGSKDFFANHLLTAKAQGIPNLEAMSIAKTWDDLERSHGYPSAYGRATAAVDYLIALHGIPSVIDYFRLFKDRTSAEQNFETAFDEPVRAFEKKLHDHLNSTTDAPIPE